MIWCTVSYPLLIVCMYVCVEMLVCAAVNALDGEPFVVEEGSTFESFDQQLEQPEQGKYNMDNT